ncbi:WD40 repeat-like protein [Aaosphaeria arxii CBS 175.79]|uniref:WD40 repeat-like protein n=1 Tax=Aaosphaeria arxii CBS 175.79 TaxID=1450172 RepID=A0A6A5XVZ3_9PLEO|nr:WD40 repeat-like protein [Aaosphaeria arxii CBS 175.79]KAF2016414.1 WD40 repeat-like protein [Aaosphaeria arxii CBS 175.79]
MGTADWRDSMLIDLTADDSSSSSDLESDEQQQHISPLTSSLPTALKAPPLPPSSLQPIEPKPPSIVPPPPRFIASHFTPQSQSQSQSPRTPSAPTPVSFARQKPTFKVNSANTRANGRGQGDWAGHQSFDGQGKLVKVWNESVGYEYSSGAPGQAGGQGIYSGGLNGSNGQVGVGGHDAVAGHSQFGVQGSIYSEHHFGAQSNLGVQDAWGRNQIFVGSSSAQHNGVSQHVPSGQGDSRGTGSQINNGGHGPSKIVDLTEATKLGDFSGPPDKRRKLTYNNDGEPTVRSLNSALRRDSERTVAVPDTMVKHGSRALNIIRSPDEDNPIFESALPESRVARDKSSPLDQELGPSDLDDDLPSDDDALKWRTPQSNLLKKRILLESPNQYRLQKPKYSPASNQTPSVLAKKNENIVQEIEFGPRPSEINKPVSLQSNAFFPAFAPLPKAQSQSPFTEQEEHLLIFLKEVKKIRWTDIVKEFPGRSFSTMQGRYSTKINRRDRALDPPRWNLPPKYADEMTGYERFAESMNVEPSVEATQPRVGIESGFEPSTNTTQPRVENRAGLEASIRAIQPRLRDDTNQTEKRLQGHHSHESAYSSATESGPRRATRARDHKISYDLSRKFASVFRDEEMDDTISPQEQTPSSRRLSPAESPMSEASTLGTVLPVDEQMNVDFDQEDATLVVSKQKLDYLTASERSLIRRGSRLAEWDVRSGRAWQGVIVHVDFSQEEMQIVEDVLVWVSRTPSERSSTSRRKRVQHIAQRLTEAKRMRASHELSNVLPLRTGKSIDAFLEDAASGKLRRGTPHIQRIGAVRPSRQHSSRPRTSAPSFLRERELGLQSQRGWKSASRALTYQSRNTIYDTMGPARCYTGASGDVHAAAWSPDGESFVAGAVCVTDPHSRQYNRPNNLLYGDLQTNTIHELAKHHVEREQTSEGPNSTHAMHVSQDKRLFTTVTSALFTPDGQYMVSAGYDRQARVWMLAGSGEQPIFERGLSHKAEVDLMVINRDPQNTLLATASKRDDKSIKVIHDFTGDNARPFAETYSSRKGSERPDLKLLPTALEFEPNYGHLLLAGYGANVNEDRSDSSGDICMWDVEMKVPIGVYGASRNVFDVAFNPIAVSQPHFAVGCVASGNVNRGTRSLVRLYDGRGADKYSLNMELECPALDMNYIMYCPYDENIVAAGCTDGRVYIWDLRWPDDLKYTLKHGKSLMPLNDFDKLEEVDTGVRFLSWGDNATRLYSGSSDGVVKVWDVARSTEDVFIKDLITVDSGIMSGAFSPDNSKLIVGEVNGSVNILEVGLDDRPKKDMEKLSYAPYASSDDEDEDEDENFNPRVDTPVDPFSSGQFMNVPFGGFPMRQTVQGPNYTGPMDMSIDAPYLREQALDFQLSLSQAKEPQCDIPECFNDFVTLTSEEVGDSQRSKDRIPDELRQQWHAASNPTDRIIVSGKSKCSNCGRPARPPEASEIDDPVLCERCGFACFHCGQHNAIAPETTTLKCTTCAGVWSIGALGYDLLRKPNMRALLPDVPSLKGYDRDMFEARLNLEDNATHGDEMNALTDYYHSLTIDEPAF